MIQNKPCRTQPPHRPQPPHLRPPELKGKKAQISYAPVRGSGFPVPEPFYLDAFLTILMEATIWRPNSQDTAVELVGPVWPLRSLKSFLYECLHIFMRAITCVYNCVQYAFKTPATKTLHTFHPDCSHSIHWESHAHVYVHDKR